MPKRRPWHSGRTSLAGEGGRVGGRQAPREAHVRDVRDAGGVQQHIAAPPQDPSDIPARAQLRMGQVEMGL
jgi:hypothetical protein